MKKDGYSTGSMSPRSLIMRAQFSGVDLFWMKVVFMHLQQLQTEWLSM